MIHWTNIIFAIIILIGLRGTFKERDSFDFSGIFWGVFTIAFVLIWGGVFWWLPS